MTTKRFTLATMLAWVTTVATVTPGPRAQSSGCLSYAQTARLVGVLERRTYPGPPNYESIRGGDRAETSYYLRLTRPVCTSAGDPQAPDEEAVSDVGLVQLVVQPAMSSRLRQRLGHSIAATGRLFSPHTGHHHAPLLMQVQSVDAPSTDPTNAQRHPVGITPRLN